MDSGIASLIGVGVGVIAANGAKFVEHYFQRRRAAQYLAVRVITTLDRFLAGCVLVAGDRGKTASDSDGIYVVPSAPLPTLELDSLDVDWKSIEPSLAYAVLDLPNQVAAAVRAVSESFEPTNVPADDYDVRQFQFARLGIVAYEVISRLAQVGSLPTYTHERVTSKRLLELSYERRRDERDSWKKQMAELGKQAAESAEASNRLLREAQAEKSQGWANEKTPTPP
ncbi:hypothetical protein D9M72_278010 [compost metagenome]